MKTISYIKNEFAELKKMPFFLGRLFCFSVLFALDELTVTHYTSPYLYYFIIALAVFFIPSVVMQALALDKAGAKLKMSNPLFWWLVLGCIATVNEIAYGLLNGVTPIYQGAVFWLFIPVLAYCGKEKGFYKLFLLAYSGPILFNIISGIVLYPFESNIYSLSITGILPVLFAALVWFVQKKMPGGSFVFFALSLISIFLSCVSLGRTGFVATVVAIPIFVMMVLLAERARKKNIEYREPWFSLIPTVIILIVVGIVVAFICYIGTLPPLAYEDGITDLPTNMIEKFLYSIQNNNLLSSRTFIWEYTFENASAIGNGPFFYMGDAGHFHAHNSFVAVLGHYGIVPFVMYCIFCVYILTTSVKYCFVGKKFNYLPFITILMYFVCGITEDLACVVVPRMFALLFYFSCALLINEYPETKTTKKEEPKLFF